MDIIKACVLTQHQCDEVNELQRAAYRRYRLKNKVSTTNDINFDLSVPCFFLGYVGERLVAFLSLFIPTSDEAEVVAFTHPQFCDKGCFTLLFDEAKAVLRRNKIHNVLFAVEPRSRSGLAVLKTLGCFNPGHSEQRMLSSSPSLAPDCSRLQLFEVDNSNRTLFQQALLAVFNEKDNFNSFCNAVIYSDLRHGYIVYTDRPIGVFNLNIEDDIAFLYGVGIIEELRGKGYGGCLMGHAMREGFKYANRMALDVDIENKPAHNLYEKCGFKTDFRVDYYSMTI